MERISALADWWLRYISDDQSKIVGRILDWSTIEEEIWCLVSGNKDIVTNMVEASRFVDQHVASEVQVLPAFRQEKHQGLICECSGKSH